MPLEPLTPEEKRLADRIQAELIEISQKQHEEAVSNGYKCYFDYYMAGKKPKEAEGLDDAIEDTADELLLWCANKPYSRWILAAIFGLWGFVFFMLGDAYGILSDIYLRQFIGQ